MTHITPALENITNHGLRQISSFKIGIVWENVDKVLYHPVAEVVLFLRIRADNMD